jgi:hypothetical protein
MLDHLNYDMRTISPINVKPIVNLNKSMIDD